MSSWAHTKYKTKNWSSYNDSLKQRGSLSIWFNQEMVWTPPTSGKRGRQQQFSDAAIQTCLTLKVLFGMPLRQTTGFVQSLLRLLGLDWAAPEQLLVKMRSMRNDIRAAPCGDAGADTTVEAASIPKCTVSNYSANR